MRCLLLLVAMILMSTFLPDAALAKTQAYHLQIKKNQFVPDNITAPANQKFVITIRNMDPLAQKFKSDDLRRNQNIPPKGQTMVFIMPLKAGTYAFYGAGTQTKGTLVIQ